MQSKKDLINEFHCILATSTSQTSLPAFCVARWNQRPDKKQLDATRATSDSLYGPMENLLVSKSETVRTSTRTIPIVPFIQEEDPSTEEDDRSIEIEFQEPPLVTTRRTTQINKNITCFLLSICDVNRNWKALESRKNKIILSRLWNVFMTSFYFSPKKYM